VSHPHGAARSTARLRLTHDPHDDFDHPLLPEGHQLRRHVLYRLSRKEFSPEVTVNAMRSGG